MQYIPVKDTPCTNDNCGQKKVSIGGKLIATYAWTDKEQTNINKAFKYLHSELNDNITFCKCQWKLIENS